MKSTPEMRARARELSESPHHADDYSRAVLLILDDFDQLERDLKMASTRQAEAREAVPRPSIRQTHTYAELEVPAELYDVVARKLVEAKYWHSFGPDAYTGLIEDASKKDLGLIDMHGIALTRGPAQAKPALQPSQQDPANPQAFFTPASYAEHAGLPHRFVRYAEAECATLYERLAFLRGVARATQVDAPPAPADQVRVLRLRHAGLVCPPLPSPMEQDAGKPIGVWDSVEDGPNGPVLRGRITDRGFIDSLANPMPSMFAAKADIDWGVIEAHAAAVPTPAEQPAIELLPGMELAGPGLTAFEDFDRQLRGQIAAAFDGRRREGQPLDAEQPNIVGRTAPADDPDFWRLMWFRTVPYGQPRRDAGSEGGWPEGHTDNR